jgi:hypothetical protein
VFHWLTRIHEWAARDRVTRFVDPILGELVINETWWECRVGTPIGKAIAAGFCIAIVLMLASVFLA